jgi:4-hydroxybenzoate polyprenyltransferase
MDRGGIELGGSRGATTRQAGRPPLMPGRPAPPDYLFLLRPMILIPVWTFFLLGAWHGSAATGTPLDRALLLTGIASFTAMAGAAYIVNQITDRETDRASGKLFLISHGIIGLPAAWTETTALAVLSICSAAILLPRQYLFILLAGAALGAAYSLEPFRLKRRPALDVLANAAANGVLNTLAGWAAIGAPLDGIAVLAPYPLAVAAVHLSTTLADIDGDRACGLRTSGVVLGRGTGMTVSTLLMAGAFAAAILTRNEPALYGSIVSLLFFFVASASERKKPSGAGILLPAKVSTLAFSLAAGVLFPAYIPALAAVIVLTRVYYMKRFGIRYPAL